MTYRHRDCIYCEHQGKDICKCLKHNKKFNNLSEWMGNHCDDLVLNTPLLLSHFFKNHDKTLTWEESDNLSRSFIEKYGFAGMKLKN